jgi:hypothetical protein
MKSASKITLRERKPSNPIMKQVVQGRQVEDEVKADDVPQCEWKNASVIHKEIGKADKSDEPIYYIEEIVDVRYVMKVKEYCIKWKLWAP